MSPPSPAPTPHPTAGPPPTSPPPKTYQPFDIWNPGGHPDILIHAAQAWRTLAAGLRATRQDLDHQVTGLRGGWTGRASDSFQIWGGQLSHALTDSAAQCDRVADQLDEVAARVRSTNDQVHELYVAMGVTVGLGIVFTVISLGVSDAAAGATMTAEATEAASLVATLTSFFDSLLGKWVVAFGINLVATGVEKAWVNPGHDPFTGWEPGDLAHALLGADALVVGGRIAETIPGFPALKTAHPIFSAAVVSGSAAGTAAFASDLSALAFEGKPLGLTTLVDVGVSAGVSGVISGAAEWGAARFVAKPAPLAEVAPIVSEAEAGDTLKALGFVLHEAPGLERSPTGLVRAPDPSGWGRSNAGLLVPATDESRSIDLVAPETPLPKLAGIGPDEWQSGPRGLLVPEPGASQPDLGVKLTPQQGNLWQESQPVRKGTFKLVLKGLSNTVLHSPSSAAPPPSPPATVRVPALPPAPSVPLTPPPPLHVVGGGTYTVRHGDSLWAIAHHAYGDGELWRLLYRANAGIGPDPAVIQPGQVLTIPTIARPAA